MQSPAAALGPAWFDALALVDANAVDSFIVLYAYMIMTCGVRRACHAGQSLLPNRMSRVRFVVHLLDIVGVLCGPWFGPITGCVEVCVSFICHQYC